MRPGQLPSTPDELNGTTKAAILLLALEHDAATAILKELTSEMVEEVTRVLASLGEVPRPLGEHVVEEFYGMRLASMHSTEGGLEFAKMLVRNALDPSLADKIIGQMQTQVQKTPFAFLQRAESENLLTFIVDEHPQTISLIISHLSYHKAAEILSGLPEHKQIEVVRRVAHMEQTNPAVIRQVESGLEARLSNMLMHSMEKVGGVETVAEILNLCDRSTEKTILEGVEGEDADLVEEIRRLMFVFEDIMLVDDKGIQSVLKEVDNDELILAMRTASDDLKEKIFGNMSARAADLIREDMEYMGPVRLADVESAQQRIVDIVRRLEESGEIIIAGRGGDKDLVVQPVPILKNTDAAPVTHRAIVLDLGDLRQQAVEIRADAEREGERILAEARAEADRIVNAADAVGHEQGDARGYTEGLERGRAEGRAAAAAEHRERLDGLCAAWLAELARWEVDFDAMLAGARDDVLRFAVAMGRQVLQRTIELDPTVVQDQLAETLSLVCRPRAVVVEIHPDDRALADEVLPALADRLGECRHVEVIESVDVGRGGCRVRTAGGTVDAAIERQIERITEALLPERAS